MHGAKGTKKSQLLFDAEFLLAMDGGSDLTHRGIVVHYCWQGDGTSKPCCRSRAECVEKMVAAYHNMFICHSAPSGSLSRWTHVGQMVSMLACGFVCRDIYHRAIITSLPDSGALAAKADSLEAGAIGVGDTDFVVEHAARAAKVRNWLGATSTILYVGTLFFLVKIVDAVMYFLMGGNTRDGARSRRPGSVPRN